MFNETLDRGRYDTLDSSKSDGMAVVILIAYWRRIPCENECRRVQFFPTGPCVRDVMGRNRRRNIIQVER
jgi:hypothetical protein